MSDEKSNRSNNSRPRLNLVINLPGAVSAGTYGAGVLDFLVEALDAFSMPGPEGEQPAHEVVLIGLSGASAGAQTAFIFASAIAYRFPPARLHGSADHSRNPFYRHWVEMNDLSDYLTTSDDPVQSLLDSSNVERVVESVLDFGGGLVQLRRPWVAEHLRLAIALTNLRGMSSVYGDGRQFARHADSMRFVLQGIGGAVAAAPRLGEQALSLPQMPAAKRAAWHDTLGRTCIASGAFPLAFAPRTLTRDSSDYRLPGLHAMPPAEVRYSFCAVDGGVFDDDPRDLAAGLCAAGRTARERTVLLGIGAPPAQPLPGPSSTQGMGVFGAGAALLKALWDEARLRPDELAPIRSSEFSEQFLISPAESGDSGLAGSGLGGFAGYFAREFRSHDFMQGRADARRALREQFCLAEDDPLFARWSPEQKELHLRADAAGGSRRLPIIPLASELHGAAGEAPASVSGLVPDVAAYRPAIRKRIRHLLRALAARASGPGGRFAGRLLAVPLAWVLACVLRRKLQRYFADRTMAGSTRNEMETR